MINKQLKWIFKLICALLGLSIFGYLYTIYLSIFQIGIFDTFLNDKYKTTYTIICLLGAVFGAIFLPKLLTKLYQSVADLSGIPFLGAVVGGIVGITSAAILSFPLSSLPAPFNHILSVSAVGILTYFGATLFAKRPDELVRLGHLFHINMPPMQMQTIPANPVEPATNKDTPLDTVSSSDGVYQALLLDTSVIIDGRITDVSQTGFLNARLLVPHFVLDELQYIADSPDPIRRKRGRRGLEVLNLLRTKCPLPFEIIELDVSEVREVDSKLVALGRHLNVPIMTNDYNLNKVAGLQGVSVLNINDLANSIKAAYLPGETLRVKLIQQGRENGQGIGYLDDGTMVVVEEGDRFLQKPLNVVVTKVLQTSAGRMVFAKLPDGLAV